MAPPKRSRKRRGKELAQAHANAVEAVGLQVKKKSTTTTTASTTSRDHGNDENISPAFLETVISELEHENERRIKKFKRATGDMRQEFLNNFHVELLQIPRKVREMKVSHFQREFGGSVQQALKKAATFDLTSRTPAGPNTPGRLARAAASSRAPRAGETIMSINGSPLAAVPISTAKLAATIKVKQGSRARLVKDTKLLVELPSGDGCVNLSEPDTLKVISDAPELKGMCITQLQNLRNEISDVMNSLQEAS